jgi:glyceraldehyde 3-phosphate dehydrogenase
MKIGINGFGRTGRLILRVACEKDVSIVQINDPKMDLDTLFYLIKYDTVHGRFPFPIELKDGKLIVKGREIIVSFENEPKMINWKLGGADIVCDSSGVFLTKDLLSGHLLTAKKVVLAAPPKDDIPLFVLGANQGDYDNSMDIISNSSCNTNCLALMCKVLDNEFGIVEGLMTTVHAITGTQETVDGPCKKDRRRGRSAAYNIVPSTTGSAKSVAKVLPKLKGKMNGMAFRVPAVDMCVVDLTVKLEKSTSYEEVVEKMKEYANGKLKGLLRVTEDAIVSSDLIGDPSSCVFDVQAGIALNDRFMKLIAWTDNEYAYSTRMVDLAQLVASKLQ